LTKDAASAAGVVARSRIYLANVGEAAQEVGGATPEELLENHPLPGFEFALLKNGRWGTTLLDGRVRTPIPAFRVDTSTTVGSGDVFAGALAARLARGDDIGAASTVAAAASAIAISEDSPLLDRSVHQKIEQMLATGRGRYVDPAHLSTVTVTVDAGPEAEIQRIGSDVRSRARGLGLRDREAASEGSAICVTLARDERGVVAGVSSDIGWARRVELGVARDVGVLIDAIADCVEATAVAGSG
jgi:hypothetical protein